MSISINYVWMNRDENSPALIPSHLFRRFQDNAELYAGDAVFHLWVKDASVYAEHELPEKVVIHDLGLIVQKNPAVFSSNRDSDFWSKVDIARLLVVKEALQEPGCKVAIYADFDIPDVSVNAPSLWRRLDKYGVAFGASFCIKDNRKIMVNYFENGFMAFTPMAEKLLDFMVSEASRESFFTSTKLGRLFRHSRDDIYRRMSDCLHTWAQSGIEIAGKPFPRNWLFEVAGLPIQAPSGWHVDTHLKAKPRLPEVAPSSPSRKSELVL